jgi:hypothetical protein
MTFNRCPRHLFHIHSAEELSVDPLQLIVGARELVTSQADQATLTSWLWHGYIAHGAVTLLTSQWKTGKTTLLSVLLARIGHGGTLAGRDVAPGKALVVSEEDLALWARRQEKLDFGDHVAWLCVNVRRNALQG